MRKILIIDDNIDIIISIQENFSELPYEFHSYTNAKIALKDIETLNPEIILLDLVMPEIDGFTFLKMAKQKKLNAKIIIISGENRIDSAVKAMKLGATDYITKPIDFKQLENTIKQYLNIKTIHDNEYDENEIVGKSKEILHVKNFIHKLAKSNNTTVLIEGETGTGKELVAKAIHFQSGRHNQPFVEINCSAIQATLLESELFGHEKGAFTGAEKAKTGLLEFANNGTFFLDEIGDMPLNLQTKLLKVLEQKKFRKIGSIHEISVDVRFICATSFDLKNKIQFNEFRPDLYYRINVASIVVPPLRNRMTDLSLLLHHFLNLFNEKFQKSIIEICNDTKKLLLSYSWPGNIRELKNVIERAVLFEDSNRLQKESLNITDYKSKNEIYEESLISPGQVTIGQLEKQLIIDALRKTIGNQTKAANILKLTRDQLKMRIKKYEIDLTSIKSG